MADRRVLQPRLVAPLLVLLCSGYSLLPSRPAIEITGEFRSDGSCDVRAGGVSLYSAADRARTMYEASDAFDPEPPAGGRHAVHTVRCLPAAPGLLPVDRRDFAMLIAVPGAGLAPSGTYTVAPHGLERGAPMTMNAAYFDPRRYGPGTPGAGLFDLGCDVYLGTTSGTARFTRIDSARVVGTFRMQAERRWSM